LAEIHIDEFNNSKTIGRHSQSSNISNASVPNALPCKIMRPGWSKHGRLMKLAMKMSLLLTEEVLIPPKLNSQFSADVTKQ